MPNAPDHHKGGLRCFNSIHGVDRDYHLKWCDGTRFWKMASTGRNPRRGTIWHRQNWELTGREFPNVAKEIKSSFHNYWDPLSHLTTHKGVPLEPGYYAIGGIFCSLTTEYRLPFMLSSTYYSAMGGWLTLGWWLPNAINEKGRAKWPCLFHLKLCVNLLLKLFSRSPKTEQTRTKNEHGGGFGTAAAARCRHKGSHPWPLHRLHHRRLGPSYYSRLWFSPSPINSPH